MKASTPRLLVLFLLAAIVESNSQAQQASPVRADRYGDPLPAGAAARLGTVRFRMGGLVFACAYAPDSQTLAAASADHTVYLFNAETGKPIRQLHGHQSEVTSLAYSLDGQTLASGSDDSIIILWEPSTGKVRRSFGHSIEGFSIRFLAFTPDGKGLVSGEEMSALYLWDPAAGKELRRLETGVRCIALSRDGRVIAAAVGGDVRLWEMPTGKMIRRLKGAEGPIRALAFSPDGQLLVSGNDDSTVWLWETATGKVRHKLPEQRRKGQPLGFGVVQTLAFSPDGKTLAAGSTDHALRFWDAATGKLLREVPGVRSTSREGHHEGGISCVAFSPDGRQLAFGQDNRLALLDVQSGEEALAFTAHSGAVHRVFFGRNGKCLFTIGEDANQQIREWDSPSVRLIRAAPASLSLASRATLSPDRKVLAGTGLGFGLHLWDTQSGRKVREVPVPNNPTSGLPYSVAFSPDGKLLALSGEMGEAVWLINANTGKTVCAVQGAGRRPFEATLLMFSPDGRLLASAGDRVIHLAEVPSGRQHFKIVLPPNHFVDAITFSPDGRTLAVARTDASLDTPIRTITVWEIASREERLKFPAPHDRLNSLVFSPDGRLLAAAGRDRAIYLWDAAGKPLRRLEGHWGEVESLDFAPDGRRLASASRDTTVLIWDVPWPAERPRSFPLAQKELEALWADLARTDAAKAYQAMLKLEFVPEQAVPLLAERLRPKPVPDSERVAHLLAQLDSDNFSERERATEALRELGWAVESALQEALSDKLSLEVRKRINDLLTGIRGSGSPTDLLRMLRGVEVLEHIHSTAARQLLRKLAEAPLPEGLGRDELRREANAVLHRLTPIKP